MFYFPPEDLGPTSEPRTRRRTARGRVRRLYWSITVEICVVPDAVWTLLKTS